MSIEIIKHRTRHINEEYVLNYVRYDDPSQCIWFPSDAYGNLLLDKMTDTLNAEYERVNFGDLKKEYELCGVLDMSQEVVEPSIGKCYCGREVILANFTNTCDCGREYNNFGQELADRRQWGEETGEHPADIGRIR